MPTEEGSSDIDLIDMFVLQLILNSKLKVLSEKREAQTSRCLKWTPSSKRSKKIRHRPPPPCLLDTLGRVQRGGGKAVPLGSVAPTKRGKEPEWLLISEPPDQRKNTDPLSKRIFFSFYLSKVGSIISASST